MCLISLTECLQQSNFLSLRTSVFQQISLARNILYPNSCYHISNCKVNLFINISYRNFSYKIRLSTPAPARFRTKPPANCAKSLEFPRARLAPAYLTFGSRLHFAQNRADFVRNANGQGVAVGVAGCLRLGASGCCGKFWPKVLVSAC